MIPSALAVIGLGLLFVALPHLRLERWAQRATVRRLERMGLDPDRARGTMERQGRWDRIVYAIIGGLGIAVGMVLLIVGLAEAIAG